MSLTWNYISLCDNLGYWKGKNKNIIQAKIPSETNDGIVSTMSSKEQSTYQEDIIQGFLPES
jgi:hypothetical protein